MSPKDTSDPKEYLISKGWVHVKKPHQWQWQLPPAPGLHVLEHALEVQKGLDGESKGKKAKAKAG